MTKNKMYFYRIRSFLLKSATKVYDVFARTIQTKFEKNKEIVYVYIYTPKTQEEVIEHNTNLDRIEKIEDTDSREIERCEYYLALLTKNVLTMKKYKNKVEASDEGGLLWFDNLGGFFDPERFD